MSRSSNAPPPVCTVCPVTTAAPSAAPGRAPPDHQPTCCGSDGGVSAPSSVRWASPAPAPRAPVRRAPRVVRRLRAPPGWTERPTECPTGRATRSRTVRPPGSPVGARPAPPCPARAASPRARRLPGTAHPRPARMRLLPAGATSGDDGEGQPRRRCHPSRAAAPPISTISRPSSTCTGLGPTGVVPSTPALTAVGTCCDCGAEEAGPVPPWLAPGPALLSPPEACDPQHLGRLRVLGLLRLLRR